MRPDYIGPIFELQQVRRWRLSGTFWPTIGEASGSRICGKAALLGRLKAESTVCTCMYLSGSTARL